MKNISICIRPEASDKPMRNILGMNNSPRTHVRSTAQEKAMFDALKLKYVRYHDAAKENPAWQIMDVSRIFPLFHLDENDPKNYIFGQTDDYLSVLKDDPIEIDFRLGESIDNSGYGRLIQVPPDAEKWARICRNIIAHYRDGLWDGMHLNINRVSIWEEPDNPALLRGDVEQYAELYCSVWRLFRKELPGVKVGGPTSMRHTREFLIRFLEICREQNTPPDFLTHTLYTRSLEEVSGIIRNNRALLDSFGFTETTDTLAEWHLGPATWGKLTPQLIRLNGFADTISAAFSASLLIDLMDIPYLDMAYYYCWGLGRWAVFNTANLYEGPLPVYYGLLFFQKLAAECPVRLAVEADADPNLRILAGKTEDGITRLLISCYETEAYQLQVQAAGAACRLYSIDSFFSQQACTEGTEPVPDENGCCTIHHPAGNAVYLLEFRD